MQTPALSRLTVSKNQRSAIADQPIWNILVHSALQIGSSSGVRINIAIISQRIDSAKCTRMFHIGDQRWLIAAVRSQDSQCPIEEPDPPLLRCVCPRGRSKTPTSQSFPAIAAQALGLRLPAF